MFLWLSDVSCSTTIKTYICTKAWSKSIVSIAWNLKSAVSMICTENILASQKMYHFNWNSPSGFLHKVSYNVMYSLVWVHRKSIIFHPKVLARLDKIARCQFVLVRCWIRRLYHPQTLLCCGKWGYMLVVLFMYVDKFSPVALVIYLNLAKRRAAHRRNVHVKGSSGSVKTLPLIWECSGDSWVIPFALG